MSRKKKHHKTEKPNSNSFSHISKENYPIAGIVQANESSNPTQDAEHRRTVMPPPVKNLNEEPKSTRLMAYGTLVIAAFTVCLAILNFWQMSTYKEATVIENQPYVVAKDTPRLAGLAIGDTIKVTIPIVNVGNTPAFNVTNFMWSLRTDTVLWAQEPTFPDSTFKGTLVLGPNIPLDIIVSSQIPTTKEKLDFIRRGIVHLYVYVIMKYTDRFDQQRHTAMCFQHIAHADRWAATEKYNHAN